MNTPRNISASRRGIPAFSVLLIMAALTVVGVAMLPMLNIQYAPTVTERKIDVFFSWPGASARLLEQGVTSRIEGALSTVSGSESVSSHSMKGSGRVTMRFRKGTDMAAARFEVASAIRNLYSKLPEEVGYPEISLATSGSRVSETLVYTIKADLPSERIEEYVAAYVSTPLSQVEGVGKVSLSGVTPFEWVITFDPRVMEPAGITAADLASAFNDYFRNDVIGLTTLPQADGSERSIVLKLCNRTTRDFGEIPVANRNGRIYYLRDFASVRWREALPSGYFRINGLNTINLSVTCEPHTNMLRVVAAVKEEMGRLQTAFPPELSATLTYDASEYVSGELQKIYLRTLLCVAILLLFVYLVSRDLRYLFIIMVTLAVNILVAVVFYNLLRLDIHIYTLAGITVSLGIIIDTSIIMVDHYSYYRDRRVFVSILGALLTTIGALCIVWLLPEEQQANLTDFSLVIVINLAVSLLVALLFVPSLLDKFPLGRSMTVSSVRRRRFTVRFSRVYGKFIAWGRRHRWIFVVALVWGFGIPTFLLPDKITEKKGKPLSGSAELYNEIMGGRFFTEHRATIDKVLGSSLYFFNTATGRYNNFREPERKRLYVNAGMAEGCTVQQLDEVVRHMENYISRFDEVAMFRTRISSYDNAQIEITFKPEFEYSAFPAMLKQELTSAAINFGGATWRIWGIDDNSFNNNVVSSYRGNQIRLQGYNYDRLSAFAEQLIDSLSRNRRVSEPEIMDGNAWSLPHNEFNIRYDDELIAAAGLDVADYYGILNTMLYKSRLNPVYNGSEFQQVMLESGERDRFDRWHITNAQVGIDSLRTKLSAVGSIEKERSGVSIRRDRQSYEILVGFDFIGSYELGKRLIERTVRQLNEEVLPIGFRADSPSYGFWQDEKQQQVWLILLVVAIIYTMCAVIFESLRKPVVIILMIPVSFVGVFLMFGWTDFVFDQGGFAAFVLLCGIVVNAGIYLINEEDNWAAASRRQGIPLYLKAYNHKIIPISLTIISTVLGLVPFLYDGPEEVFWFAFAMAAISGTLFSVIALIVFLPIFLPMCRKPRNLL
ncbi:efflux RND transporter permease subunit [Alistipes sp.]|uniref:efflux RND transporter permease subunit n=1 Tax=Alistipes sp. TaxID=1872444 RepID=UPI003AF96A19